MVAYRTCLCPMQVSEGGRDVQHTGRIQAAAAGTGLGVGDAALPESPSDQYAPPGISMAALAISADDVLPKVLLGLYVSLQKEDAASRGPVTYSPRSVLW